MFATRVIVSLFELSMMIVMSALVITQTYRLFVRANPDFHMGEEVKRGNVAVGILVATILLGASYILMPGTESSVAMALAVVLLLSAVVLITSMYVRAGMSALSKAMTPQPSIGRVQVGQ